MDQEKCDVCGRSMTTQDGMSLIGLKISLIDSREGSAGGDILEIYPEIELGREYKICFVCCFKSLGVRLK